MKSLHGLTRTLINTMVVGVTDGYTKTLEVNGVGYRAQQSGKKLTLHLGYSHPVEMEDPEGLEAVVEDLSLIHISRLSLGVEFMWSTIVLKSHWVRYSKLVFLGRIIRSMVCACSMPPF